MSERPARGASSFQTGRRQHVVPQQMIRRFTNANGVLFALRKPDLTILAKIKRPKGVLWREDYYKDATGDLDAQWLTPIEQRFAGHYPALADHPWETHAVGDRAEAFSPGPSPNSAARTCSRA